MVLVGLFGGAAQAQDALSIDLEGRALFGQKDPALVISVHQALKRISVELQGDAELRVKKSFRTPQAGDRLRIPLPLPRPGAFRFQGTLLAQFPDQSERQLPLDFRVESVKPLEIQVEATPESVREGRLRISASDRPLASYRLALFDDRGQPLRQYEGDLSDLEVRWPPENRSIGKIELRITGRDGSFRDVSLFPWRIDVPHEEVHFDSGKAVIAESEQSKLRSSLQKIQDELRRVRPWADPVLFVAGHTDTVGSAPANRALSARRARAIAAWFKEAGLSVQIRYAGLGEAVLARATADEVDAAENRRAEYIISVEAPPLPPPARWRSL